MRAGDSRRVRGRRTNYFGRRRKRESAVKHAGTKHRRQSLCRVAKNRLATRKPNALERNASAASDTSAAAAAPVLDLA
jgi:hypothetical protein